MRNYLFYDNEEGINFIVEAETLAEAEVIADDEFGESAEFIEEISDEVADMLGYDTF